MNSKSNDTKSNWTTEELLKKSQSFSPELSKSISLKYLLNLADAEWVHIAPGKVVVTNNGRTWLYQPSFHESRDCFTQPIKYSGSTLAIRQLLDGAIAAAKFSISSSVRPPALTSERWVWRLAGLYHQTHFVPQLMKKASQGFTKVGDKNLVQWASQKACEEKGHDLLALQDIQSLKYDAEAVVKTLVPPAAIALINYLTRSVQDSDPIDCVGYVYTMERLALCIDRKYIQKIEALLPSGTSATRCLRVHSNIGADAEHVEETIEMLAGLTSEKLSRIAVACYETALLCFSHPSGGYISNKELQQILSPLKSTQHFK
jgi:hypothetical protein